MARHYYLTRSGRLRRKDNTLCFEPSAETEQNNGAAKKGIIEELFSIDASQQDMPEDLNARADDFGDLMLQPEAGSSNSPLSIDLQIE